MRREYEIHVFVGRSATSQRKYDLPFSPKLHERIRGNLLVQMVRKLEVAGLLSFENVFIDGTKMEANANRYSFVWRNTHTIFRKTSETLQDSECGGGFRRFMLRGEGKVEAEWLLLSMAYNLLKLDHKLKKGRLGAGLIIPSTFPAGL